MMYAFSLLSLYVVFMELRQWHYNLSLTLHLIGLCLAHRWGDSSNILADIYCIVKTWIQRTSHTIKSYVHVDEGNEMSDMNGDDER